MLCYETVLTDFFWDVVIIFSLINFFFCIFLILIFFLGDVAFFFMLVKFF